eukprot:gene44099-29885_t
MLAVHRKRMRRIRQARVHAEAMMSTTSSGLRRVVFAKLKRLVQRVKGTAAKRRRVDVLLRLTSVGMRK